MTACVSIEFDTSTTFTAKRQSLAAKGRFRSLKGALFCRKEDAYRIATVSQPVRFRTFRDYYRPERWLELRNPSRAFGTLRPMSKPHEFLMNVADQFSSSHGICRSHFRWQAKGAQRRQRVRAKRGPMTSSAPCPPNRFGKLRCPAIGGARSKLARFFFTLAPTHRRSAPLRCAVADKNSPHRHDWAIICCWLFDA